MSSKTHGGPGPGAQVHVPLHTGGRETVRITEGELKGDVATVLSRILTISIPGVGNWQTALPVLEALQPRQVLLAFDSDWRKNSHVALALAFALLRARYRLFTEDWHNEPEKGIDDLLAAGKAPTLPSAALAIAAKSRVTARILKGRWPCHATV